MEYDSNGVVGADGGQGGSSCNVNVVGKTKEISADDFNSGPVTVCELECRGCEVVSWRSVEAPVDLLDCLPAYASTS